RWRFLARNRLIAALSQAAVVVEASWRSGALSTARLADQLSRPVGAVPGPVTSAASAGSHRLIRERGAVLVTEPADLLDLLPGGPAAGEGGFAVQDQLDLLTPADRRVLDAVPPRSSLTEARIADEIGFRTEEVDAALARLELLGLVIRAGQRARRARPAAWRDDRAASMRDTGSMSTQREHDDAAVVDAFAEHLRLERGRSEHTVSAYRREAAALLEHLRRTERIALEELDVTALRSWLGVRADSGAGASTLARSAAAARTFTTWLAATGRIPHDVGGRLRAPRRGRHLPTMLSGDQAGALLDGMGERADGGPRSPAPRFAASRD